MRGLERDRRRAGDALRRGTMPGMSADPAANRRFQDVGPPPDADAAPAAAPAPARVRKRPAAPVSAPADPDVPFEPLAPGELLAHIADSDPDAVAHMPERSRAELAAYRARTGTASSEPDDTLAVLRRLLSKAETADEFGAALKALELLEKRTAVAGTDGRRAPELTRAELQVIARGVCPECEARSRVQISAAPAARVERDNG